MNMNPQIAQAYGRAYRFPLSPVAGLLFPPVAGLLFSPVAGLLLLFWFPLTTFRSTFRIDFYEKEDEIPPSRERAVLHI